MSNVFSSETKRKRLDIRHAPYWEKVSKGRSLGYRKGKKQTAWMGRIDLAGKFKYTTFEHSEDWDLEYALEKVTEWYATLINIDSEFTDINICGAVNHYEQRMSIQKNPKYATENAQRVRKHLSDAISLTKLSKLTKRQILGFRDGMVSTGDDEQVRKSKVSTNRVLNTFKAILNLAYEDKLIGSKSEWETVKTFVDVDEARKLYMTDKQVKCYLAKTSGAFHDLCKAAVLTGNRIGSLTSALVKDFDKKEGTIRLVSRKGNGKVKVWHCYLRDDALTFFEEVSKDKLPTAPLLTDDSGEQWLKNGYRRAMLTAKQESKMPADFDMYAFRHYHISKALLSGIQAQVIAENCGTSVRMLEKHYAKFVGKDRRAMMNTMVMGI
jgi:integrase